MSARTKELRHNRIIDLRVMIIRGKTLTELKEYCLHNLKITSITADSYINEAAAPYRKKYVQEQKSN